MRTPTTSDAVTIIRINPLSTESETRRRRTVVRGSKKCIPLPPDE